MDGTGVALISFVVIIVIIFVIGMCMGNWNGNGRRRRKRRKTREKFTAANVMQRLLAGSEDGDLTRKVRVPGAAGMELEGLFGVVQITTEGPPELITEVAQVQPDNNGDYWEPDENGNFSASITFLNSIVDASGFDDSGVESFTPQMRKAFQKHRLRKTTPDSTWSSNGYREHLEIRAIIPATVYLGMRGRYLIVLLDPNATTDLLEDLLTFRPLIPGWQACPLENGACTGTINFFPSPAVRGMSPRTFG